MSDTTTVPMIDLGRQFRSFEGDLVEIFRRVGRSGMYVDGSELRKFQVEFAEYCDVPYAVGVGNATDGLAIVLQGMGIGRGDEVITAANSFVASGGSIAEVGATPVFADIREDLNIDPGSVARLVTSRTKAIMPVHLTGQPADMDALHEIAKTHSLKIIEDAAQAVGACYKGKCVGGLGDAAVFSLHPLKNLHVYGDGGVITTKSSEIYNTCMQIRNHGLIDRDTSVRVGRNSRLDEVQAAIATYKLAQIDDLNERFRAIAHCYSNELSSCVVVPREHDDTYSVYHNYVIQAENRDALKEHMASCGIATKIRYPRLINQQPAYGRMLDPSVQTPVALRVNSRILSLPIFPEMTNEETSAVINAVQDFYS